MELKGIKIGFALTGSFCTFKKVIPKIKELINAESWLGTKEIEDTFDVNLIKEQKQVAACASNLFKNYKNVPKEFKNMIKKAEEPKLDYSDFEKRLFNIKK